VKKGDKAPAVVLDFNLAQLLKQTIGAARSYALNERLDGIDPSIETAEALTGTVKFVRTKSGALVTLAAKTSLRVVCSRCLDPVIMPINLDIEEEFLQTVDVITGLSLGASREDPALLIDGHHDMHLADLVREYLLVALPMQPLCRDDCKGLCPHCGSNLNNGACTCSTEAGDDRWAALKTLLS
jgi:uncharacterized protein